MKRCNIVLFIPAGLLMLIGIVLSVAVLMPIILAAFGAELLGCDERSKELFALLDRMAWWA